MKRYIYIAIGIVSMIIATSCQKDATNVVEEKEETVMNQLGLPNSASYVIDEE